MLCMATSFTSGAKIISFIMCHMINSAVQSLHLMQESQMDRGKVSNSLVETCHHLPAGHNHA